MGGGDAVTLNAQLTARVHGTYSDIRGHLEFIREQAAGRAVIAELGVRAGNSTCAILAAIEQAGTGELWSVDIAAPQVPVSWLGLPHWHFLRAGDTTETAQRWLPAQLDMLLIDTSHEQAHTLAELEVYGRRVREGGVILLHDTCWAPGDVELREPAGPVAQALETWCRGAVLTWVNRPGSYGMGVVRIPAGVP
jgi:predicted O-methyltransferase YrrM